MHLNRLRFSDCCTAGCLKTRQSGDREAGTGRGTNRGKRISKFQ